MTWGLHPGLGTNCPTLSVHLYITSKLGFPKAWQYVVSSFHEQASAAAHEWMYGMIFGKPRLTAINKNWQKMRHSDGTDQQELLNSTRRQEIRKCDSNSYNLQTEQISHCLGCLAHSALKKKKKKDIHNLSTQKLIRINRTGRNLFSC